MPVSVPSARSVLLAAAPPQVEAAFFSNLVLPSGAYKTTFAGRFTDLDACTVAALDGRSSVRLLDIGVSSGVTTVELIDALERAGIGCSAVAADLVVEARLVEAPVLGELLVDREGRFLQCAGGLGVRMRPYPRGPRRLAAAALDVISRRASGGGSRGRGVQLVTSRLAGRENCVVVEHDVFSDRADWHGAFDLIRAANLLNLAYFPSERIRSALRLLESYLAHGGLLVLCRTDIETRRNNATILRRAENGLTVVERLGDGSEVEDLALSSNR